MLLAADAHEFLNHLMLNGDNIGDELIEVFVHSLRSLPFEPLGNAVGADERHFHWFFCRYSG